ncbi:uncharacterized protein [Asterias amurensis]|uniref:uncharacterized protein n=1 Tax=Asterias amurensis TaxID=7602 RepID=UPI003AB4D6F7
MVEPALLNQGWHLSKEGLERCRNGSPETKVDSIIQAALNTDLRHIGIPAFSTDTSKGKGDKIQGPMVLQIQKVRNISAPKANEDSGAAPPLLRLQLTDGHTTVMAVVLNSIAKISMTTPPGSKLKLQGCVAMNHGFLLLTDSNCKVLGGQVEELIQRWHLAKSLAQHTRNAVSGSGGPPPWIPFGQRGAQSRDNQKPTKITIKKSLDDPKPKELTEQEKEFEEQRKAAIQEVNKSKQGQGKTFGGSKSAVTSQPARRGYDNNHGGRDTRRGDQFEAPVTGGKPRSEGFYRDLDYGGYQPNERDIQQLVTMGFQRDAASNALRKHTGNMDAAIEVLVTSQSGPPQIQPHRHEQQRPDTRPERGHGRRGRRGGDEDEEQSAPPAAPATLFDFLQPKLGKDKGKSSEHPNEVTSSKNRNFAKEQPYSVQEAGISFVHKNKGQGSNFGQGSNSNQWDQPDDDSSVRGYNTDRKPRRDDYSKGRGYGGNENRDRRPDFNQQKGYNQGRRDFESGPRRDDFNRHGGNDRGDRKQDFDGKSGSRDFNRERHGGNGNRDRKQDFDGKSGPRRDDFNRHGGNDRGDKKQDFNSTGFNSDRNKRNFDQKSGPRRDDFSREPRFGGNDSGDRAPNRSNNKENSNYRGSFREKNEGARQKDTNHHTQEITNHGQQRTENQTNQRENMSRGGQQRSSDRGQQRSSNGGQQRSSDRGQQRSSDGGQQRSSDSGQQRSSDKKADYKDSRPPRFQKHNDSYNDSVNVSHRTTARDEAGVVASGKEARRNDTPPAQSTPAVRPGEPCQAKYWEDGQFYNAVLTAVHPSGRTCVVLFPEYGNHEEVKMADTRPIPSPAWTGSAQAVPGPPIPPLLVSHSANPGVFAGPTDVQLEFYKGGEGRVHSKNRQQREPRQNTRPSQNFYQPPDSRK